MGDTAEVRSSKGLIAFWQSSCRGPARNLTRAARNFGTGGVDNPFGMVMSSVQLVMKGIGESIRPRTQESLVRIQPPRPLLHQSTIGGSEYQWLRSGPMC